MTDDNYVTSASGVRVPGILYGTAWKKGQTAFLVEQALRLGYRGLDTACQPKHYSEDGVGAGVASVLGSSDLIRADLYLQTKFTSLTGQDPKTVPYDPEAPLATQVSQSFQQSLKNLQTDYIDCLVLHSPMETEAQTAEVWHAMEDLVDAGGVRQLGISNCYNVKTFTNLHQSARIKPAVLQNRFYAETRYDRTLRAYCMQHGIVYQSFWTLTANSQVLANPKIKTLSSLYQRSPAQILFRYLTQIGIVPLTGTKSEAHMREDLDIFKLRLADEECEWLQVLF